MSRAPGSLRLGGILLKNGFIRETDLAKAMEIQQQSKKSLGEILLDLRLVSEENLGEALSQQLDIPFVPLSNYLIDPAVISALPEDIARRLKVVPLFLVENSLTLATTDPGNLEIVDQVRFKTGCQVNPVIATASDILNAINQLYGRQEEPEPSIEARTATETREAEMEASLDLVEGAPVVRLVNQVLAQAIRSRASDIHLEPGETGLRVRSRIDGILRDEPLVSKEMQPAVLSRIKILAGLDIAERRVPQDGRIQVVLDGRPVDLRVSSFPTIYGEKIVLRILDKGALVLSLTDLGFLPDTLARYRAVIRRPNGILLVTGPTGSGKTSTLYATLLELNSPTTNIITLEDPVEYRLAGINQGQANPRIGFSFASGLRSILRQDPDIILVGEIRDKETAEVAVQAALTGHLVLSTLHTNDAPGAVTRLLDMGVEPFLVASTVIGVLAQRLVRRLCPSCREPFAPTEPLPAWHGEPPTQLFRGRGCRQCGTGFRGRVGIYELMMPSEAIRSLILRHASASEVRAQAVSEGMRSMMDDGREKVLNGITSYEEVVRVAYQEE